jgi:hypothetical protein
MTFGCRFCLHRGLRLPLTSYGRRMTASLKCAPEGIAPRRDGNTTAALSPLFGAEPKEGYMSEPSKQAQERAVERLALMAEVGLAGGHALFRGDELDRVEWFKLSWGIDHRHPGDVDVPVPPPSAFEDREELIDACRAELWDALHNRGDMYQAELPGMFEFFQESKDDPKYDSAEILRRMKAMAGWLHDDAAERDWKARLAEMEA